MTKPTTPQEWMARAASGDHFTYVRRVGRKYHAECVCGWVGTPRSRLDEADVDRRSHPSVGRLSANSAFSQVDGGVGL